MKQVKAVQQDVICASRGVSIKTEDSLKSGVVASTAADGFWHDQAEVFTDEVMFYSCYV